MAKLKQLFYPIDIFNFIIIGAVCKNSPFLFNKFYGIFSVLKQILKIRRQGDFYDAAS